MDKEKHSVNAKFSSELSSKSSKDMYELAVEIMKTLDVVQKSKLPKPQLEALKFAICLTEAFGRKKAEAEKSGAATVTL